MQFTKQYTLLTGLTHGIRTHWTTTFVIDDDFINGYRTINSKLYHLKVSLEISETFSSVLNKVDRLVMIEDGMYKDLAEIMTRTMLDIEDSTELTTEDSER